MSRPTSHRPRDADCAAGRPRVGGAKRLHALGAEALETADLLALAAGLSRRTCRALLDHAGGLGGLAGWEALELAHRPGVSPSAGVRLAAAFEIGRRVASAAAEPGWRIRTPADVADRLCPSMRHLEREELRVLLLTTKNEVTGIRTVYAGNLSGSSVRVGEVYRDAVRRQAAAVVVVHNHPSGDPTPSADDLRITTELAEAGRLLDIELLDHVVVAARGWVSLRALGVG